MIECIEFEGIEITKDTDMSMKEVEAYVDYLKEKNPNRKFKAIDIAIDPNDTSIVTLDYKMEHVPIERIRRITGYLVGTMDKWNDGKTAEEKDRVKHSLGTSDMERL